MPYLPQNGPTTPFL